MTRRSTYQMIEHYERWMLRRGRIMRPFRAVRAKAVLVLRAVGK